MIRVLHIVGKMNRAGAETMLMNLYRNIDRTQVQFDFITFTQEKGDYNEEILALGGKIFPIIAHNPVQRMLMLRDFLKENSGYNIVHAHMLLNNAFHLLAAKMAGIKNLISHAHSTSNGKSGVIHKSYEKISRYLNLILSTEKIACGEAAAEYLFTTKKDVWVMRNAIDLNVYQSIAIEDKEYWSTIIPNFKGLKIIQVGRLNEVKNHLFSLDIAKKMKEQNVNFMFFIVGQGPLENLICQKIKEYGLEDHVKMLSVRSDVPELMAGADVMLMPSLHEGFPVVLVESQAIGLPSILSENIAREVDLNLGLIEFLSLKTLDPWVEILKNQECKPISQSEIYTCLSDGGFEVKKNALDLLNFYKNLNNSVME